MGATRLRLPDSIRIRPLTEDEARDLAVDAAEDRYLLTDHEDSHVTFVVSRGIKEFLECFREPSTPEAAARSLAARTGGDAGAIEARVREFSSRLRHARVLRRETDDTHAPAPSDAPPPPLLSGTRVGAFTVVERIARTRVTEIFRGADADGRPVALKVLTPTHAANRHARAELRREVALVRSLPPHPSVCAALAYVAGERPAAVLEYVDGETIRDLVPKPELSLPERARAASGVLAAMAHLHAHGVLHGDVHSRNFMRTTDGGVKVIDFGLARRSAEDADAVAVHGGVPYYMPPERIRPTSVSISLAPGGECSEVYQLGVLLFELLSGQLPHRRHPRWRQLVLDIQAGRTLPLESTPAGERIPAPLSEVVLHALTPDPARRPQSAVELARAWHEAVGTGGAAPCP